MLTVDLPRKSFFQNVFGRNFIQQLGHKNADMPRLSVSKPEKTPSCLRRYCAETPCSLALGRNCRLSPVMSSVKFYPRAKRKSARATLVFDRAYCVLFCRFSRMTNERAGMTLHEMRGRFLCATISGIACLLLLGSKRFCSKIAARQLCRGASVPHSLSCVRLAMTAWHPCYIHQYMS